MTRDSTKQTPPAGDPKAPDYEGYVYLPDYVLGDGEAIVVRSGKLAEPSTRVWFDVPLLKAYLLARNDRTLAALGLRRVAEEAGQVNTRCPLGCSEEPGGFKHPHMGSMSGDHRGELYDCERGGGLYLVPITPAQVGEAPGGGEADEAGELLANTCSPEEAERRIAWGRSELREMMRPKSPPPTAAPERDAGEKCSEPLADHTIDGPHLRNSRDQYCAHGKRPAAPRPEPDDDVDLGDERCLSHERALRARVAELTKEKEYIAESQALIAAKLAEWEQAAPAEVDRLRTQLASATESAAANWRLYDEARRELEVVTRQRDDAHDEVLRVAQAHVESQENGAKEAIARNAAEAKLEAAQALIERSHLHPEVRRALLAALASDSPTTGKDGTSG